MQLREKGIKAGVVRPRVYRPFPTAEIIDLLKNVKAVAVVERATAPAAPASPVYSDLAAAMFDMPARPKMVNYVTGLGGRDTSTAQFTEVFERLQGIAKGGEVGPKVSYLGARE
jgi:pyruvate ferredoxin oxidoreductase alpha subunit